MRVSLQAAFVIHRRNYRDTSLIVELFTPDHGRLSAVARGARSGRSRGGSRAALLQPFTPLLCSWSGRSELKTLTGCEAQGSVIRLHGERLFSALYVNELISRLLHHEDPHPGLYADYQRILHDLAEADSLDLVLRRFEFALLEELGYGFELGIDGRTGEPLEGEAWYSFHPEYGLVRTGGERESRVAGSAAEVPRFLGEELLALSRGDTGAASRRCAKRLMRRVLAEYLGDRPLKSRELFARPA